MAKTLINYYDEAKEFMRMEDCAEKTELAVSRLENPYSLTDENWAMYQDWLQKTGPKTVAEFTDKNRLTMFPLLVKYKVIRKANVNKMVDYAQEKRKMDILSYLLNVSNDLRNHPKALDIAPKFTPGKSENNAVQQLPSEKAKAGDIVWLGIKPMPWLVMENRDGRLMLISKYAFDCQAYHNTFYRRKWEECSLSKWLDDEYFTYYFSEEEKDRIRKVYLDEKDRISHTAVEGAKPIRFFALSVDETKKYFRTEEERRARVTIVGRRKILWQHFDVYAHWWLRTESLDVNRAGATHVLENGDIKLYGGTIMSNGYDEFYDHYGVRPAMYLTTK